MQGRILSDKIMEDKSTHFEGIKMFDCLAKDFLKVSKNKIYKRIRVKSKTTEDQKKWTHLKLMKNQSTVIELSVHIRQTMFQYLIFGCQFICLKLGYHRLSG